MSEEAEALLRKEALKNKLSSVLACLLFMGLGFGILYFTAVFIVGDTPVSFLAYTPPAEDGPPTNNPQPRELTSRSQPASSSVAPSVIVTTSAASVSMAPVEIDMSDGLSLDSALDIGLGDTDLGEGLGSGGSGLGSGQGGGSALEGTFYDLKQTGSGRSRKASHLGVKDKDGALALKKTNGQPIEYYEVLANFLTKGWSRAVLGRYYESPVKLYASNFYLPVAAAKYAPIAYQVGDPKQPEAKWICQPSGWCAVYRGRVRAPKTGKFRFIGMGDDCMAVRFDRKLVLEGGYRMLSAVESKKPEERKKLMMSGWDNGKPSEGAAAFFKDVKAGKDRLHKDYEIISSIDGLGVWKQELGGLMAGTEFSVKEGQVYEIEIMVAESGGAFGFVLFIEDTTNGKNSKARKYDLFRTNFSTPSAKEVNQLLDQVGCRWGDHVMEIPYNEDSLIWTAVP